MRPVKESYYKVAKSHSGWRRLIGSPKLQIIFHKTANKYRSLLQNMTYKDKGSYESSPPCKNARCTHHAHTCAKKQENTHYIHAREHTFFFFPIYTVYYRMHISPTYLCEDAREYILHTLCNTECTLDVCTCYQCTSNKVYVVGNIRVCQLHTLR